MTAQISDIYGYGGEEIAKNFMRIYMKGDK